MELLAGFYLYPQFFIFRGPSSFFFTLVSFWIPTLFDPLFPDKLLVNSFDQVQDIIPSQITFS